MLVHLLFACADPAGKESAASLDDTATYAVCKGPCGESDNDGVEDDLDCAPDDPEVFPGNTEICDGKDNDCDDVVDEGVMSTFYADADGDAFGDPAVSEEACEPSAGWSDNADDCDDTTAAINPEAQEACNAVDDDCDGAIDEDLTPTSYADADGDGWGDARSPSCDEGAVANADDCDDADPAEPVVVHDGESIEAAIEIARLCAYVYAGTYPEDLDLLGKDLIVWGVDGAEATVVTGTGEGSVLSIRSGEAPRVVGFTLTGGRGAADDDGVQRGGGVYVSRANPTLEDLVVTGNTADLGGGVYVEDAVLDWTTLEVRGNSAATGGGVYGADDAVLTLSCSEISDNDALDGGALAIAGWLDGNGLLVAGNVAEGLGGGVLATGEAFVSLTSSTVADNDGDGAVWVGEASSLALTNAIVSGNDVGACVDGDVTASLSVTFSDVWGCAGSNYGAFSDMSAFGSAISADPLFTDPAAGAYTLAEGSPCLDAGEGADCAGRADLGYTGATCACR